jgi:hypothetical protein
VSESRYVFIFSSLLSLFIYFFARDYLEVRVYMALLTYSAFPSTLAIQFFLTFSSCHALILSHCSALIYCRILYFELRLYVLMRFGVDNMTVYASFTLISISISALSSPTITCEQILNHGRIARVCQNLGVPTDPMITL